MWFGEKLERKTAVICMNAFSKIFKRKLDTSVSLLNQFDAKGKVKMVHSLQKLVGKAEVLSTK